MTTPASRTPETPPARRIRDLRLRLAGNRVRMAALATLLLANLLIELLGGAVGDSAVGRLLQGPLTILGYIVVSLAVLVWLAGLGVRVLHGVRARHDRTIAEFHRGGAQVPSAVRLLAEQAAQAGGRLATDAAADAASWFRAEEPALRRILGEGTRTEGPLPRHVVDDLTAIASALETWYVRRQQLAELTTVNDDLRQLATRVGRPDLQQLAALRVATAHRLRGDLGAARAELVSATEIAQRTRHPYSAALEARQHHEWALIHLAEANRRTEDHKAAADELENAARVLEAGWARLPRADISGEITTLVNLAAVGLHHEHLEAGAGRRDPAAGGRPPGEPYHRRLSRVPDHLGLAEALARAERDLTGLAHVIELRGVAAWLDEQHELAATLWRDARDRYAELGLADGQARCLQHLGSAIVVVPEVAGLLRDNQWVALDERVTDAEARWLLEHSKTLRASFPGADTALADHYLALVGDHRRLRPLSRRTDSLWPPVRRFVARVRRWRRRLS